MTTITNKQKRALVEALKEYADLLGAACCTDFSFKNTDENYELIKEMYKWNGDPENTPDRPKQGKDIWTSNFFYLGYLTHLLEKEIDDDV